VWIDALDNAKTTVVVVTSVSWRVRRRLVSDTAFPLDPCHPYIHPGTEAACPSEVRATGGEGKVEGAEMTDGDRRGLTTWPRARGTPGQAGRSAHTYLQRSIGRRTTTDARHRLRTRQQSALVSLLSTAR